MLRGEEEERRLEDGEGSVSRERIFLHGQMGCTHTYIQR